MGVVLAKMYTPEVRTERASRATGWLRSKRRMNYHETSDVRLPRAERVLFPVEVVEKENKCVQVHYVGFSTKYDEWREESELESVYTSETSQEAASSEDMVCDGCSFEPFSLHNYLKVKIKQSLSCTRENSHEVRIVVPFDAITLEASDC